MRRLDEDQVDRIRSRARIDLVSIVIGGVLAVVGTVWLASRVSDLVGARRTKAAIALSVLALLMWWVVIVVWRGARRRQRVSTSTRVRRLSGVLTSTGGKYATFSVDGVRVWFARKVDTVTRVGAWVVVDVLDDGEIVDIVSTDHDVKAAAKRKLDNQRRRREHKRKRTQRNRR